jgi:hypothetical protein
MITSRFRGTVLAFALGLLGVGTCSLALGIDNASPSTRSSRQLTSVSRPRTSRHASGEMPASARQMYALTWGVDELTVKIAESGQLVRFSYRVTDADKAGALNEKTSTPYLLDEKARAILQVPTMEKVGPLRQSQMPEIGKSYWMVFSNKGDHVKVGDRVSVVIGRMRVDGLIVQ